MMTFEEIPNERKEHKTVKGAILYAKLEKAYFDFKSVVEYKNKRNYLKELKKIKPIYDKAGDDYYEYLTTTGEF